MPQGSLLGPILFIMNIQPLADILTSNALSFHFNAYDTQTYLSVDFNDISLVKTLTAMYQKYEALCEY